MDSTFKLMWRPQWRTHCCQQSCYLLNLLRGLKSHSFSNSGTSCILKGTETQHGKWLGQVILDMRTWHSETECHFHRAVSGNSLFPKLCIICNDNMIMGSPMHVLWLIEQTEEFCVFLPKDRMHFAKEWTQVANNSYHTEKKSMFLMAPDLWCSNNNNHPFAISSSTETNPSFRFHNG